MTKQAGNTSADREAELRKRLADDAGSFGCPADIADLFAMLDEARAQLDEDAEQDAQIEEDAVAEHEHDLEVAYWANQVRDACDVLRPGRFGRGEPGEDPPIVTMAKAVVAERDEATKRAETAERDLDVARSQRAALYEVGARYIKTLGDGEWIALAHALDDADTAAREYEARVRAPVEAERDHLAHIIDNICGIAASPQIEHVEDAVRRLRDERDALATALAEMREHARVHGYAALATAPATDLAAQREARVRTDERGKALREAADALDPVDGNSREVDDIDDVPGWLRARAERSR